VDIVTFLNQNRVYPLPLTPEI